MLSRWIWECNFSCALMSDIPNGTNQIDEHLPGRAQGPSSWLMKCHMAPRMCVTLAFFLISNSSVDGGVTNASSCPIVFWWMLACSRLQLIREPKIATKVGTVETIIKTIWVNYNELTTSSLEIIVSKGNHPQMALIQVSELLSFAQMHHLNRFYF